MILRVFTAVLLVLGPAAVVWAQDHGQPRLERDARAPEVLRVAERLACDCGCPHEPISKCNCGTAQRYRLEIAGFLEGGLSEEETFDAMMDKYGAGLLREPPDTVMGIIAKRVLPFGLAAGGLVIVGVVVMRWRRRPEDVIADDAPSENEDVDDEYLARVNRELEDM